MRRGESLVFKPEVAMTSVYAFGVGHGLADPLVHEQTNTNPDESNNNYINEYDENYGGDYTKYRGYIDSNNNNHYNINGSFENGISTDYNHRNSFIRNIQQLQNQELNTKSVEDEYSILEFKQNNLPFLVVDAEMQQLNEDYNVVDSYMTKTTRPFSNQNERYVKNVDKVFSNLKTFNQMRNSQSSLSNLKTGTHTLKEKEYRTSELDCRQNPMGLSYVQRNNWKAPSVQAHAHSYVWNK